MENGQYKKNINLLPHDLRRRQTPQKPASRLVEQEYTAPVSSARVAAPRPSRPSPFLRVRAWLRAKWAKQREKARLRASAQAIKKEKQEKEKVLSELRPLAGAVRLAPKPKQTSGVTVPPVVEPGEEKTRWWQQRTREQQKNIPAPVTSAPPIVPPKPAPAPVVQPAPVPNTPAPVLSVTLPTPPELKASEPKVKAEKISSEMTQAPARTGQEFEVNLLSKEYAREFGPHNQRSIIIGAGLFAVVVIGFFYALLHLYLVRQLRLASSIEQVNEKLSETITSYSFVEQESAVLYRKVQAMRGLLATHISMARFLEKIETVTLPEVTYLDIAITQAGTVSVTALSPDYTTLARQLVSYNDDEAAPWITQATVTDAGVSGNPDEGLGVKFNVLLTVDTKAFVQE